MRAEEQIVSFTGFVNLSQLDGAVKELSRALKKKKPVTISFSEVTDIDLAGIQVLFAARKYSESHGGTMKLGGTIASSVSDRFQTAGFIDHPVTTGDDLETALFRGGERRV
jgi:anti-anti-sigma regulatory factor